MRVAHLSPDALAVDLCLAPAGTQAFVGPVLAGAGALDGIAYGKVTKYLEVEAQPYDVRLVNVGANDCTQGLGPDTTNLPALPAGGAVTIAATGKIAHGTGSAAFQLRAYVDDATVGDGEAKLRFIHASPGTQKGFMRFVGLAVNDPKQLQYQLWIFDKHRDQAFPVDGGVFDITPSGEVIVPISAKLPVGEPTLFAVTVEKPGGVVVSKRERIVVTAAPSKTG